MTEYRVACSHGVDVSTTCPWCPPTIEMRRVVTLTFTRAEMIHRAFEVAAVTLVAVSADVRPGSLGSSAVALGGLYLVVSVARDLAGWLGRRRHPRPG